MQVKFEAPEVAEVPSEEPPEPSTPTPTPIPISARNWYRRGSMRILIRVQLAALVLFVTLVALAISAIATWITQKNFFLYNRGGRMALIAALKAAQLSSSLVLAQSTVVSLSSRVRVQDTIISYNAGNATAASWEIAQDDIQEALANGQLGIFSVDAIVYPASGSGNSSQIVNLQNATEGSLPNIMSNSSGLIPNFTYNGSSTTQSTAQYNGAPLGVESSLLLGPFQVNDSLVIMSITVPIISNGNPFDVLGFMTVVMNAQSLTAVLESQIGLEDTGTALVVGPASLDNHFSDALSYNATSQNRSYSQETQTPVHFVLRPVELQYSDKRHLKYANGQSFSMSAFPALSSAFQLNAMSSDDSGSMLRTSDEEGYLVSVGFALVPSDLCTWALVFEQTRAETLASLYSLQRVLIGTVFGGAAAMTLFIIPLAGWATSPLRRLRLAALGTIDYTTRSHSRSANNSLILGTDQDEITEKETSKRRHPWVARSVGKARGWLGRKTGGDAAQTRRDTNHSRLPGKVRPRTSRITDELTDLMTTFNLMSEELSSQWFNLEQRVRQRTIELEQSKKEAEAANESKSLFIANVSHELKTPLAGILGMCALCQQEASDPEKIRHSMDIAMKSGDLLTNLLNDLLQFSKSSGKHQIVLEQKPFTLPEVQSQLRAIFDNLARQKRVPLSVEIEDSPEFTPSGSGSSSSERLERLSLYGDQQRLLQVLINLLSNALKFSPEMAPVRLSIRCLPEGGSSGDEADHSTESLEKVVSHFSKTKLMQPGSNPRRASLDADRRLSVASSLASIPDGAQERWYEFQVSDHGPGIDKALQRQIFEPFMQGDLRLTKKFGGTGLGLSICRQLTGLMNGSISVESELGKGSTFTVRVPFRSSERQGSSDIPTSPPAERVRHPSDTLSIHAALQRSANTQASSSSTALPMGAKPRLVGLSTPYFATSSPPLGSPPEDERRQGKRVKVLVAEDNFVNQEVVLRMLRLEEVFDVHVAKNGQEALDMVKASIEAGDQYDMILMDVQMPVLDGRESTRLIRQIGYEAPIVALSAFSDDLNRDECLKSGMDNFLSKPIKQRSLRGVLDKYLPQLQQVPEEKTGAKGEYFKREAAGKAQGRAGSPAWVGPWHGKPMLTVSTEAVDECDDGPAVKQNNGDRESPGGSRKMTPPPPPKGSIR